MLSFGKLTSLMGKHGPAPVTIVGLQMLRDNQHGGQHKGWWGRALCPILNRILLFGGVGTIRCAPFANGR